MPVIYCSKGSFTSNTVNLIFILWILESIGGTALNSHFSLLLIRLCFEMFIDGNRFVGDFEGFFVVDRWMIGLFFNFGVDM